MVSYHLQGLCSQYVAVINRIESAYNQNEIRALEERRGDLHYAIMHAMQNEGIDYVDRWHVTELAYSIANGGI